MKQQESSFLAAERDALRKMVLLRWSVGAVGAVGVPGGAGGGARFGVLRLGEGACQAETTLAGARLP
jgi:hypothetical protein